MRNPRPAYQALAALVQAVENCQRAGNAEWEEKHSRNAQQIVADYFPSGSGWDIGTELVLEESNAEKLVFRGAYHHMDEGGGYDGWTEHDVVVKPSLASGYRLSISGRDRNSIKEYLHEIFSAALDLSVAQESAAPFRYYPATQEAGK
jgi:hypothetical protein